MQAYRRNLVAGGTYFFTVNLQDRSSQLLTDEISGFRVAVRTVKTVLPFEIAAWVILPEHMHCIWRLPEGDTDYPRRWRMIKATFSQTITLRDTVSPSRESKGERHIWQRRYWEHTIRDDKDYAAHMDYIHFNPVKHGYVGHVADWPYSSFRHCVARGLYPSNWGFDAIVTRAGERD